MTGLPVQTRAPSVITTHQNADFDAFSAAVAASKLYPEARIVFSGSLNRNVREFLALHGEDLPIVGIRTVDLDSVRSLIVVDTADCGRLGELGRLCGRNGVDVIIFDHHPAEGHARPPFVRGENWVVSPDGSQSSSMLYVLRGRDVHVSPLEATIFALGIHEDTGSLTYPRTTIRDAEMLALAMRLGASQALIERYLHSPLTRDQQEVLMRVVDVARPERVKGQDVHVAVLTVDGYVDGLSVIAHKVMDLLNCETFLQVVGMEDRVFVTARSRAGSVDVAEVLRSVGGGGHAQAASAVVRHGDPHRVLDALLDAVARSAGHSLTAADIMSRPVRFIEADTSVADALLAAQRYGHSGISVKEDGRVVGIAARRDLDKAVRHGLGHAPVKGFMSRNVVFAHESDTIDELRRLMADTNVGRLPIVRDESYERVEREGVLRVSDVAGIATRTDVLAVYQGESEEEARLRAAQTCALEPLGGLPFFGPIFRSASALSEGYDGVYLVGGFVRDLLLHYPNADVDIAVEGDGIEFARSLARILGGRVRAHKKFQTAVVLLPPEILGSAPDWLRGLHEPFHVDVATARTEFYDYPAALPSVEHASIRQDLFRRDFTVNAMAVSLKADDFGTVLDFFGGLADLHAGVLRVLHNLSFIEDPTRIFRAVRYENRYGFRMDEQTKGLARACVDMHLVGDLSSARLRDELVALLGEQDVDWSLGRLFELGVAKQVHPRLATGVRTVALIHRLDALVQELDLGAWVVTWRLRLTAITRNMNHEELFLWLERLRLREADSQVVRKSVVLAPRLMDELAASDLSDWDVYRLLVKVPEESLVFALALPAPGQADMTPAGSEGEDVPRRRVRRFLAVLRRRTLAVSGDDVVAEGVRQGPEVGRILREVRRARVEGDITSKEEQVAMIRSLVTGA
jgi:tRNA nucleotidyltransferase (CCA-adding enzyme)